jgi:hypothetical protein
MNYITTFDAANPAKDAGVSSASDAGASRATCPTVPSNSVAVTCTTFCEGRRTEGVLEAEARAGSLGEYFATCANLEAVSVLAFIRLRREATAHGAPPELLDLIDRARCDEERHLEVMTRLARRVGHEPELPCAADAGHVRSPEEIARENAVEGCIRETWGATLALFRASRARDAEMRAAFAEIAEDEARHAELAWAIDAWIRPRLDDGARAEIDRAARGAVGELGSGDFDCTALADTGMPTAAERAALLKHLDREIYTTRAT